MTDDDKRNIRKIRPAANFENIIPCFVCGTRSKLEQLTLVCNAAGEPSECLCPNTKCKQRIVDFGTLR